MLLESWEGTQTHPVELFPRPNVVAVYHEARQDVVSRSADGQAAAISQDVDSQRTTPGKASGATEFECLQES